MPNRVYAYVAATALGALLLIALLPWTPLLTIDGRDAAGLAAFFSRARADALVPVDYTLAKHVFKAKGAKPGMVYYTAQRTIVVNPIHPGGE